MLALSDSLAETTTARVAARIRDDILHGRLAPGSRLKILDLATRYRLSHMPIREALRDLEGEGLIELSPHRGATIRHVDQAFVDQVYDLRGALEVLVARRAAERADVNDLATLEGAFEDHRAAVARGVAGEVLAADRAFHDTLAMIARNPMAARALASGRVLIEALRLRSGFTRARLREVVAEHRALLDAVRAHDVTAAADIAHRHVQGARASLSVRES